MQKIDTRHTYQQMIQQHQTAAQNFQPTNQLILASGGYDNTIRMWNVDKGFCDKFIQNTDNSHVNALAITPNRELLASAGFQHIRLYDVQSNANTPLINFEGISKNVSSIGFSPSTTFMYTGGEDFYARIWDTRSRRLTCQRHCGLKTPINSLFLHPNEIEIYIADQSGSIWIWNLQNDQLQRLFVTNDGFIQHIAYDKECRLLAAIDTLGKCYIFQKNGEMTASGYLHRRLIFQAHDKYGLKCCFSPDSTLLATTSADTTVKFWRTSDLSIVNSTNTIQIDDPSETKANQKPKSQTNAGAYEHFLRCKDLWRNTDDAAAGDPAALAMLGAPFLARLFPWKKIQPQKPPRCYLKRRRHNHSCDASNRNTCCKYVNNNHNGGRSSVNGCARCSTLTNGYRNRSINSFNILQSALNDSKQFDKNDRNSSQQQQQHDHHHHHHHHFHHSQFNGNNLYQSVYTKYLDNNYNELYNKLEGLSLQNGGQTTHNNDIFTLEQQEDEEFLRIIKELKLVDSDFDDDDDESDDENDNLQTENGHINSIEIKTSDDDDDDDDLDDGIGDIVQPITIENNKKNYIGRMKKKSLTNSQQQQQQNVDCCCSCDLPNFLNNDNNFNDNDQYENGGGELYDNNERTAVKKKQKNEWSLTEQITPFQMLKRTNQRWVWDLAFSADSQYVFTASSDHYVRLWSVYSGQMTREFSGHQKAVTALAFSDVFVE
uniref:Target of rapamycin complex subunit lst8 n=1 Tax=Dermatophagoides pteronyssinus TaxID=6956 RepID=A0A6P6XQA7_DERPT|nr:WD repeat-containing protein 48 homolog [Dermatophagoides pteronyssinus]